MSEFRYRAFISYAHADQAWAAWLHKALEGYRLPSRLAGLRTDVGPVPRRLTPIFRDRDDLTAAHSLTEPIRQALEESATLIVVCSPAAVQSRWVEEEIRHFESLGRRDRIYCVIVDGDASARQGPDQAFPACLLEGGATEPLAADARKWADGKRLALLKLVAGLVGIRLDDLRQRDKARQTRWRLLLASGLVAVLALAGATIQSRNAEQQERARAEQLANFIVDLGERVQSDVDLETQALISEEALEQLASLDPNKLSMETRIRVGLALRQFGQVNEGQGQPAEALEAYEQSRALFRQMNVDYPRDPRVVFELSQAEFYVGNTLFNRQEYDRARPPLEAYYRLAIELNDIQPGNPAWVAEVSYSITSLVALRLYSGEGVDSALLDDVAEAVSLLESAMENSTDDPQLLSNYATTRAWEADAYVSACRLEKALESREVTRNLAAQASGFDPSDNELKAHHAYAISGVAFVQIKLGELSDAEASLESALALLSDLAASDASNMIYQEEIWWRKLFLARVFVESARIDEALTLMDELQPGPAWQSNSLDESTATVLEQVEFLFWQAYFRERAGQPKQARQYLDEALEIVKTTAAEQVSGAVRTKLRYRYWSLDGADPLPDHPELAVQLDTRPDDFVSCDSAAFGAQLAMMEGDRALAQEYIRYLADRGYKEGEYLDFVKKSGLEISDSSP